MSGRHREMEERRSVTAYGYLPIQVSLSPSQSEALEAAARKLLVLRGQVPWPVDGFDKPRARLFPPRWLVSAAPFKSALARRPDADLLALSELWAQTGHAKLTGADPDAVFVPSGGDLAQVRAGLLALGVPAAQISEATHAHGTSLTILRPPDARADPSGGSEMAAGTGVALERRHVACKHRVDRQPLRCTRDSSVPGVPHSFQTVEISFVCTRVPEGAERHCY